jgi:cytochrome b
MSEGGGEDGGAQPGETVRIRVWDWPVRAFHWALMALMVVSVIAIEVGGNSKVWHMRAGYAILALVLFRIAWGFAGTRYARFASFVRGPGAVLAYLKDLSRRSKKVYVGHNPLGGWSVVALLALLLVQAGTGLFANDDIITEGPLVRLISKELSDSITWFHRRNGWALWSLVGVHVAAVLYYLLALKENLIRPMITGAKTLPRRFVDSGFGSGRGGVAVVLLALAALAVWWLVR